MVLLLPALRGSAVRDSWRISIALNGLKWDTAGSSNLQEQCARRRSTPHSRSPTTWAEGRKPQKSRLLGINPSSAGTFRFISQRIGLMGGEGEQKQSLGSFGI
jgi:hypothetical protein